MDKSELIDDLLRCEMDEIIKNIWDVYNGIWTDIAVGTEDEGKNGELQFFRRYQDTKDFNLLLSQLCKEKIWSAFINGNMKKNIVLRNVII